MPLFIVAVWVLVIGAYYLIPSFTDSEFIRFRVQLFMAWFALGFSLIVGLTHIYKSRAELGGYFTSQSPIKLAFFRITFFGVCSSYVILFPETLKNLYEPCLLLPETNRTALPIFGDIFSIIPFNESISQIITIVWCVSAVFSFLGFMTRLSIFFFCVSTFYLFGIPQYYSKVVHYHYILWYAIILSLSPCGNALSIDSLIQRSGLGKWQKRLFVGGTGTEQSYSMPIVITLLTLSVIYFFPGFWKLLSSGLDWCLTNNLSDIVRINRIDYVGSPALISLPDDSVLYHFLALGSLCFELSFWYLIFFPKGRVIALVVGVCFHLSVFGMMQINFLPMLSGYVCLIGFGAYPKQKESLFSWASFSRHNKLTFVIYILFFALCFGFGALKITNGWPFACFPTFDSPPSLNISRLSFHDENQNVIDTKEIRKYFSPSRYRALEQTAIDSFIEGDSIDDNYALIGLLNYFDLVNYQGRVLVALDSVHLGRGAEEHLVSSTFIRNRALPSRP